MNMSYCRFQNTDKDLAECADALESLMNDPAAEPLSRDETEAAKNLIARCFEIAAMIADAGNMTFDELLSGDTDSLVNRVFDQYFTPDEKE